jgi:hypothetical protein
MFSIIPPTTLLLLVVSALLCLAAVGVTAYLLVLLFYAFMSAFGGVFEDMLFRRHTARCAQGDALLKKGDLSGAMQTFARSFFLNPVRRNSELLSDIANFHTGLLSRLLTIADDLGNGRARLPTLARTDRLLSERLELQLDYFRSQKRDDHARLHDLERHLRENQTRVRSAITQLITEIRSSEEKVLYH